MKAQKDKIYYFFPSQVFILKMVFLARFSMRQKQGHLGVNQGNFICNGWWPMKSKTNMNLWNLLCIFATINFDVIPLHEQVPKSGYDSLGENRGLKGWGPIIFQKTRQEYSRIMISPTPKMINEPMTLRFVKGTNEDVTNSIIGLT